MSSEGIKLGNRAVEQFVKGDVVNLKSVSPVMTVIGNAAGDVVVAWFIPPGQVQTAKFPPEALEKYVAPEPKAAGQVPGDGRVREGATEA